VLGKWNVVTVELSICDFKRGHRRCAFPHQSSLKRPFSVLYVPVSRVIFGQRVETSLSVAGFKFIGKRDVVNVPEGGSRYDT
jgi:hypothetical protein